MGEDPSRRFTADTSYLSEPNHSRRQAITLVTSKHRQYASRKNPPILLLRLPEQTRRRPLSCTPAIPRPQRSDRRVYPRLCRRSLHLDNQSHRPGRLPRCPCPTGPRAAYEHRQERRQRDAVNERNLDEIRKLGKIKAEMEISVQYRKTPRH